MILFELLQSEDHPAYQQLSIDNLERQYGFLRSIINAALAIGRPMVSTPIIKALNGHAIACLHVNAGQYRPGLVTVGKHNPPLHYRVPDLMEDMVNQLNHAWVAADSISLATWALWRLNYIHPFINGNGRTARALCYYIICVKTGGMLRGTTTLPALIRRNRDEYVQLLQEADELMTQGATGFLNKLHAFIERLVNEQLDSVPEDPPPAAQA